MTSDIRTETAALDRRRYQLEVERLLEQIRTHVRALRGIKAHGARGPALTDRSRELEQARERLAHLVTHAPDNRYDAAA